LKIYTIGFTKKNAETFFTKLRNAGVQRIVDVRLNNVSQLAGFAKSQDLPFFAKEICGIGYIHLPELAPTQEMLDKYKKHKGSWEEYDQEFRALMVSRKIEKTVSPDVLDGGCMLCSEHEPEHCHRRIVAEYLQEKWQGVEIVHLV
jgi:uncharacterized protein (DUF488 family)